MPARDDYILRMVDLLRQAIMQSIKLREKGRPDQAMFALMVAQEKLFARPIAEFAPLPLEEQLRLLMLDEPPEMARQKVLIYAKLLREAAINYEARDRPDLAENTFQLALNVALQGVLSTRGSGALTSIDNDTVEFLRDILKRIPPSNLHAPTVEMLQQLQLT
ncbi:MAG TPA: hypothetical protein VIM69_07575 [Opitutaceae bacterium]